MADRDVVGAFIAGDGCLPLSSAIFPRRPKAVSIAAGLLFAELFLIVTAFVGVVILLVNTGTVWVDSALVTVALLFFFVVSWLPVLALLVGAVWTATTRSRRGISSARYLLCIYLLAAGAAIQLIEFPGIFLTVLAVHVIVATVLLVGRRARTFFSPIESGQPRSLTHLWWASAFGAGLMVLVIVYPLGPRLNEWLSQPDPAAQTIAQAELPKIDDEAAIEAIIASWETQGAAAFDQKGLTSETAQVALQSITGQQIAIMVRLGTLVAALALIIGLSVFAADLFRRRGRRIVAVVDHQRKLITQWRLDPTGWKALCTATVRKPGTWEPLSMQQTSITSSTPTWRELGAIEPLAPIRIGKISREVGHGAVTGATLSLVTSVLSSVTAIAAIITMYYATMRSDQFQNRLATKLSLDDAQAEQLRQAIAVAASEMQRTGIALAIAFAGFIIATATAFLALRRVAEPVATSALITWTKTGTETRYLGPVSVHNVQPTSNGWSATVRFRGRRIGYYDLEQIKSTPDADAG